MGHKDAPVEKKMDRDFRSRGSGPEMSSAGRSPVQRVTAADQSGFPRKVWIPGEGPLTIKIDQKEIVTLMTLGTDPEELTLGYLRNQRLIENLEEIASVQVDWEKEVASVLTTHGRGIADLEERLSRMTVTSGCGQGTVFSCTIDHIFKSLLPAVELLQSTIYRLLKEVGKWNQIYKQAGSVHGCGLCKEDRVIMYVEDVGRHNAADTIAGRMWLDRIRGEDKILYSTGRLTSEIVIKAAEMGIPVLISRSGVTQMALDIAQDLGVTMIGRAKGKRFLAYSGADHVQFDVPP